MNAHIDKILRSPSQDLFVYDKISGHWFCRENSDFFCPEPSIEVYTKLVVQNILSLLDSCKIQNAVADQPDYDYNAFNVLIEEKFYGRKKEHCSEASQRALLL
jgi:hypothetical protein